MRESKTKRGMTEMKGEIERKEECERKRETEMMMLWMTIC